MQYRIKAIPKKLTIQYGRKLLQKIAKIHMIIFLA